MTDSGIVDATRAQDVAASTAIVVLTKRLEVSSKGNPPTMVGGEVIVQLPLSAKLRDLACPQPISPDEREVWIEKFIAKYETRLRQYIAAPVCPCCGRRMDPDGGSLH